MFEEKFTVLNKSCIHRTYLVCNDNNYLRNNRRLAIPIWNLLVFASAFLAFVSSVTGNLYIWGNEELPLIRTAIFTRIEANDVFSGLLA